MVWPFGRRKPKGKPKRKASGKAKRKPRAKPHAGSERARRHREEFTRKRSRAGRRTRRRPSMHAHEEEPEVQPWHRAPPGPAVWQWVKRAPPDYFVGAWHEPHPWGFEDYRRWPRDPPPRMARRIRRHVVDLILEAGRSQWPQEFAGLLRAEDGVVEELVLLPGTVSGDTHAIFQFHMMPSDPGIVGTIHSHPNPVPYPSAADTELFRHHGRLHIIACHPFRRHDWNAFNERSHKVELEVVD